MKNKALKKYLHDTRNGCFCNHKTKRIFISQLRDSLITYAEENTNCTYEDLINTFGNPQELCNNFEIEQKNSIAKTIFFKIIVFSIMLSSIILITYTAKYFYDKWEYSNGYDIETKLSPGNTDDNVNPFTHQTDAPVKKTYNFKTDYAK